jgi:hypothetical protein
MSSTHNPQRAFRPRSSGAMPARAYDKEISFALVPIQEAKAQGAAARAGRRSATCT